MAEYIGDSFGTEHEHYNHFSLAIKFLVDLLNDEVSGAEKFFPRETFHKELMELYDKRSRNANFLQMMRISGPLNSVRDSIKYKQFLISQITSVAVAASTDGDYFFDIYGERIDECILEMNSRFNVLGSQFNTKLFSEGE